MTVDRPAIATPRAASYQAGGSLRFPDAPRPIRSRFAVFRDFFYVSTPSYDNSLGELNIGKGKAGLFRKIDGLALMFRAAHSIYMRLKNSLLTDDEIVLRLASRNPPFGAQKCHNPTARTTKLKYGKGKRW